MRLFFYIWGINNAVMAFFGLFKKEEKEYDDRTCIIVVEIEGISIGLIIDRVVEVANIDENNISLPPKLSKSKDNSNK